MTQEIEEIERAIRKANTRIEALYRLRSDIWHQHADLMKKDAEAQKNLRETQIERNRLVYERDRQRAAGGVTDNDSASVSEVVTECEVPLSGEGASGEEVPDGLRAGDAGRDEPEPDQIFPVEHGEGDTRLLPPTAKEPRSGQRDGQFEGGLRCPGGCGSDCERCGPSTDATGVTGGQ